MLGRKTYTESEIAAGRSFVRSTVTALADVADAVPASTLDDVHRPLVAAAFLGLDRLFVHRLRAVAGNGTNPCTELTLVVEALLRGDGVLAALSPIKYKAEASVLGVALGDPVPLTADAFARLGEAFVDDVQQRFAEPPPA